MGSEPAGEQIQAFTDAYTNFTSTGGSYFRIEKFLRLPNTRAIIAQALVNGIKPQEFIDLSNPSEGMSQAKAFSKAVSIIMDEVRKPDDFLILDRDQNPINVLESAYNFDSQAADYLFGRGKNNRMVGHFYTHAADHARKLATHARDNKDSVVALEWDTQADKMISNAIMLAETRQDWSDAYHARVSFAKDKVLRGLDLLDQGNLSSSKPLILDGVNYAAEAILLRSKYDVEIKLALVGSDQDSIEAQEKLARASRFLGNVITAKSLSAISELLITASTELSVTYNQSSKTYNLQKAINFFDSLIPSTKIYMVLERLFMNIDESLRFDEETARQLKNGFLDSLTTGTDICRIIKQSAPMQYTVLMKHLDEKIKDLNVYYSDIIKYTRINSGFDEFYLPATAELLHAIRGQSRSTRRIGKDKSPSKKLKKRKKK